MMLTSAERVERLGAWMAALASGRIIAEIPSASMPRNVLLYGVARTVEGWRRDEARWRGLAADSSDGGAAPGVEAVPPPTGMSALGGAIVHAILPGNSPAPCLNLLASAWLRGARLRLRPSRDDRAFVGGLVETARRELAGFDVEVVADFAGSVDLLIAFGSDETVAKIEAERAQLGQRLEGYGHRWSMGLLLEPPGAGVSEAGGSFGVRAGVEIVTWNQGGCLSPLVYLVPRAMLEVWKQTIAEQLALHEEVSPRGAAPAATLLAIHTARMDARARGCEVIAPEEGTAWTVLVEKGPRLEPTPAARTIRLSPFDDLGEAWASIENREAELEAVGIAAVEEIFAEIELEFARRPGWIVRLGEMQSPPLLRPHGRRPSIAELIPL